MSRHCAIIAAGLLCNACCAPLALLADDDDMFVSAEMAAENTNVRRTLVIQPEYLDRYIFGRNDGVSEARERLQLTVEKQIASTERHGRLTESQRQRLRLAAAVDTERFFAELEVARGRLADAAAQDMQAVQALLLELEPLRKKGRDDMYGELYGEKSFYAKALRRIRSEQEIRQRQLLFYRASVELHLITLGAELGFSGEQDTALIKLVLDETEPPGSSGGYENAQILTQLANIPATKVGRLLSPEQAERLQRRLEPFRSSQ
jgi:hypothetical protein